MYYDPLRDKTPYGATASGQPTTFRFTLPSAEKADRVTVILRRGTEEFRADLRFARFDGDGLVYEGAASVPTAGLWYYRFESVSGGRPTYYGSGKGGCAGAGGGPAPRPRSSLRGSPPGGAVPRRGPFRGPRPPPRRGRPGRRCRARSHRRWCGSAVRGCHGSRTAGG